jgi:5-methylcytosine-specific restriction protein A
MSAPRICPRPMCANVVPCPTHPPRRAWAGRPPVNERYSSEFFRNRPRVLERDDHTCQECGATPVNIVDHIVPKARGGSDAMDNLRAICSDCHKAKTQQESRPS